MGPVRSNTMDSQTDWFQSPVPSRAPTPLQTGKHQRQFGFASDMEDQGPLAYRSRMRPDRTIATDPEM